MKKPLPLIAVLLTACDREPPFSLGSAKRVADIRSAYTEDIMLPPLAGPDFNLKGYKALPESGMVLSDKVILCGEEIVAEEFLFKAPGQEPLTGRDLVTATVPWAAKWTESTVKRVFLSDLTPFDAPLYTATRPGWVAKLYGARGTAYLVVVKQGTPGLNIDDLVPGWAEKEMVKYAEEVKADPQKVQRELRALLRKKPLH